MPDTGWIEKFSRRFFSWITQKEVKTPLSFFFRVILLTTIVVGFALYFSAPAQRYRIFQYGIGVFLVLTFVVAIFAWFRPKNLVYGETGYKAESKFAFGTEKKEMAAAEIAALPGQANPKTLPSNGGQ